MITREGLTYDEKTHSYFLDGEKLFGVSSVSKIGQDAWGPASWWGYKIGYEGALEVFNQVGEWFPMYPEEVREKLKEKRLTPNHVRDDAAKRGTWIHDLLEALAMGKELDVSKWPEAYQGYIQGVASFILEMQPEFEAVEVQVFSTQYKFAGRYDIRATLANEQLCLIDLKTSKRVYPETHFVQLAGYELASVEMGFEPTDVQYILNIKDNGTYKLVQSTANSQDFINYLRAEESRQRIIKEAK